MADDSPKQSSVQFILIGTALALAGGFFAGLANILVKWVGVTKGPKLEKYKKLVWTLVIISYILNGLCDFAAFAFAPLSVVAPISALTIATNAALAYIFFKEKLTKLDALGSVLVIAGSAIATSVGSRQSSDRTLDELNALWERTEWIVFASFEIISMFVLIVMTRYLGPTWPGLVPWLCSIIKRTPTHITEVSISRQKDDEPSSVSIREPAVNKNPVLSHPARSDSVSALTPTFHRNDSTLSVIVPSHNTTQPTHVTHNSMIHVDMNEPQLARHNSSFMVKQYVHDKLRHQMRAVCYAFLASYLANWTNVLGKIAAEVVSSSIRGNNGFIRFESYLIIAGVIFFAIMQLKCMTEMMAIFEAVLIIPIYQCVFMITLIIAGACFFDEFETLSQKNIAIFCSAIIICCIGVYVLSQRAPPQLGVKPQRPVRSIKPMESQREVDEDEMNLQHVTVTTPANAQHVVVGEPVVHTVTVDATSPLTTMDSPHAVDEIRPAVIRVSSTSKSSKSRVPPTLVRPISNSSVYSEMHIHSQPEYAAYQTPPTHVRNIPQQVIVPPLVIPSPSVDGVSEKPLL